jgi:hypothetical protein
MSYKEAFTLFFVNIAMDCNTNIIEKNDYIIHNFPAGFGNYNFTLPNWSSLYIPCGPLKYSLKINGTSWTDF